jgi:hypothetical protein
MEGNLEGSSSGVVELLSWNWHVYTKEKPRNLSIFPVFRPILNLITYRYKSRVSIVQ